jgi:hypothetical protein
MQRTIRRVGWLLGVAWFLSWFELYLEVFRHHHVAPPHVLGLASAPAAVPAGARAGGWLRTVLACAALAPPLCVAVRVWSAWAGRGAPAGPSFPIAWATAAFGLGLCELGTTNQLIWRPPLEVDLTLRTGNGGSSYSGWP